MFVAGAVASVSKRSGCVAVVDVRQRSWRRRVGVVGVVARYERGAETPEDTRGPRRKVGVGRRRER